MIIRFKAFGPLRRFVGEQKLELEVNEGSNVADVLQVIIKKWGSEVQSLIMNDGQVSGNLIIMLNMRDIHTMEGFETLVKPNDKITILPHVQGG